MSADKAIYPNRPPAQRPKKPSKGINKPSSNNGGGKRKSWLSLREKVVNGLDLGARRNDPWWKCPMMKEARLKKAAS